MSPAYRWPASSAIGWTLVLVTGLGSGSAAGQNQPAEVLPRGEVFAALVADPKQPHFFAAYLVTSGTRGDARVGSVGFGENIGLVRGAQRRWQISISAAVFSQFDMRATSRDLLNSDFLVGFPFTWRRGRWSARARVYHQSSHLGDEFLINANPQRVNLSYEAVELLGACDLGAWRIYAGGERLVRHDPANLKPGLLHAGLEYRPEAPLVRSGRRRAGRLVAALDVKASEERRWRVTWSGRAAIEFGPLQGDSDAGRRWSAQLHVIEGPAPYGQFYGDDVSALGAGLHFSL